MTMRNNLNIAFFLFAAQCAILPAPDAGAQPAQEDSYVQVRAGHLVRNGRRLRLWGINTQGPTFRDGVKVQGVGKLWTDPDDIAPPKEGKAGQYRPYYAFTLVSDDGLALAQSKRLLVSLVSTSQNTGYAFDPAKVPQAGPDAQTMAKGILSRGTMPVQVNRVGASVAAPFLIGKKYSKLDFGMEAFEQGEVKDKFVIAHTDPLFIATFHAE